MSTPRYASETEVPIDRSKSQIEALLKTRKVEGYHTGWDQSRDMIEFLWRGNQIRFVLPRPKHDDYKFSRSGQMRSERQVAQALEQADRQRWRALYLVIRAKIEAVEADLSIFEEEFLAFIVVPGRNETLGQILVPRLKAGEFNLSRALPAGDPLPRAARRRPRMTSTMTHFVRWDEPGTRIRRALCGVLVEKTAHDNNPTCADCQAAVATMRLNEPEREEMPF
jgi:hypothetical protein